MARVRAPQHRPDLRSERELVGLRLADQVTQRALPDHREQRPPDRLVRLLDRRRRQPEQDALLATDALEIVGQRPLHAPLRGRVDLVHQADQQVDERVGDLALATPAQRAKQRQPDRLRRRAQIRRIQPRRPRAPRIDELLRAAAEQAGGQLELAHGRELVDLAQQRLQADAPGIRLQLRQQSLPGQRDGGLLDERFQPRRALRAEPLDRLRAEALLKPRSRRPDDPFDPARRLDPRRPAAHQHRVDELVGRQLDRAHLLRQPSGQRLLVGARRLPKPEHTADLRPVPRHRSRGIPVRRETRRRNVDLLSDIGDRSVRHLARIPRKARLKLEELQQDREPESRRSRLVRDPLPIIAQQRPRLDQILRRPFAPHTAPSARQQRATLHVLSGQLREHRAVPASPTSSSPLGRG